MAIGKLKIHVFKNDTYIPIENAKITVINNSERGYRQIAQDLSTDSSGIIVAEIETPSIDYSITLSSDKVPYSLCNVIVESPKYKKLVINGCQVFPETTAIQECYLNSIVEGEANEDYISIPDNSLIGKYPSKIPESDQPIPNVSGLLFYVPQDKRVIPNYITVHAGHPNDLEVPNHRVKYKEYIKNVAASEIYANWPKEAIKANVVAIISFTLNRMYTEWYLGKKKDFHITNSTATDQAFSLGRTLYEPINNIVDEIFSTYIEKTNYEFPLLAQYCDCKNVTPPKGQMSQWGSMALAEKGRTCEEILKYYYGADIKLSKIEKIGDLSSSYPGYSLQVGSKGEPIEIVQKSLNRISNNYPEIKKINVDSIFGENTKNAVKVFQRIFSLAQSGIVDYATWYKISDIYIGVLGSPFGNRIIERTFVPPIFYRYTSDVPTFTYYDKES